MWTEEQWDVIAPKHASSVVVAAPGSGKTTVMTEHMAQRIAGGWTPAHRILAMTFTRQAAEHMRQKLRGHERLRAVDVESCTMGTFHAVFFRALLEADMDVYPVLSQREQYAVMREAMVEVLGERRAVSMHEVQSCLTAYSRAVGAQTLEGLDRRVKRILRAYDQKKRAMNRWDHDDILMASLRLFHSPAASKGRLFQMKYVLVDEFQDTNELQWVLFSSLLERNGALGFVVGDDDQSIYAFRGASPVFLQRAAKSLPHARQYLLTFNFRSDRLILRHAASLIRHVRERVDKPLRGVRDADGICRAYQVRDRAEQWRLAAYLLQHAASRNFSSAVLGRTRNQLAAAWAALRRLLGTDGENVVGRPEFRTFHDSKGKEWDSVILLDMAVSCVANLNSDEERRLLYVAITRARHELYALVPRVMDGIPKCVHPFLLEAGIGVEQLHGGDEERDLGSKLGEKSLDFSGCN